MSAHESMEHAEHTAHTSGDNKKIALLIAVIALCLALSETLGERAQSNGFARMWKFSNLWAFLQAKSIRRAIGPQTQPDRADSASGWRRMSRPGLRLQKQIDESQTTADDYRSEPSTGEGQDELAAHAKQAEERATFGAGEISPF